MIFAKHKRPRVVVFKTNQNIGNTMLEKIKKIGIIGAMDIEVKTLKSLLSSLPHEKAVKITEDGSCTFAEGLLDGIPVVIVQSGIGKVNAALCAQRLILQHDVTHIINTGIAGAIARGLKVQDIVLSIDALYHDFDAVEFGYKLTEIPGMKRSNFPADEKLIDAAAKAFESLVEAKSHSLFKGRIATGDQFVASKELKSKIMESCSPACVEMEGAAIAHACYLNQVPFIIIRSISDMADDNGENTYNFNKEAAADLSAKLVRKMISFI